MKRSICSAVAFSLIIFLANPALATIIDPYGMANWTQDPNGRTNDMSGVPNSIALTNYDNGSANPAHSDFTILIPGSGVIMFGWNNKSTVVPVDPDGLVPDFDHLAYTLNGVFTQLTNHINPKQSRWETVNVLVGNIFGFLTHSVNSDFGPANTVIDNFTGPMGNPVVPMPGTILFLGSGLMSLGVWRLKKVA